MEKQVIAAKAKDEFVFDHTKYEVVSKAARLREIKLISSAYQAKPEAFLRPDDDENVKKRFSGKVLEFNFDPEDGIAWGRLQWYAEVKVTRKNVIKLTAEYLLLYSDVVGCDIEHVAFYFKKVGRFATYPYFRSHFSQHVGETGIAMDPLPTLSERVD